MAGGTLSDTQDEIALPAKRGRTGLPLRLLRKIAYWIESHPVTMRWILAGPIALILAIVTMAAMPFWMPEGAGGIDHLAMPVVLFPLIWAAALLYPCLDERL
ncbi:MAG: hypothetical protein AAFV19_24585, partial [Pseudomonadota bacterium]